MIKNLAKRKQLRRKLRRRAAALVGTAIMTGAVLAGVPVSKTFASEAPLSPQTAKIAQEQAAKDQSMAREGWHEHKHSWPGSDENEAWYKDGKLYYRSGQDNEDTYFNEYAYYDQSPVSYVQDHAGDYGFNTAKDTFSLVTVNRHRALVQVIKADTGRQYRVILRWGDDGWTIRGVIPA